MPTESFEIADSQDIAFNAGATGARVKVGPFNSDLVNNVLDTVKDALMSAGWALTGSTPAQCRVIMPFGCPVAFGPDVFPTTVGKGQRMIVVQGITFYVYDPFRASPGTVGVWVPAAGTSAATMGALLSAIAANTVWYASSIDADGGGYVLESSVSGTEYNGQSYGGQGSVFGVPYFTHTLEQDRGGWILRATDSAGQWLEVWMYAQGGLVQFEFRTSEGGEQPTFSLFPALASAAHTGEFVVIANQFQFAIVREKTSDDDFLFASLPYREHGCASAAVIAGTGSRASLGWTLNSAGSRDGELRRTVDGQGPKVYLFRALGQELQTSQGFNLISAAWISVPNAGGDARIVGTLWDAIVLSRAPVLDDTMVFRGLLWQCIARNAGFGQSLASLWIAYSAAP